MREEKIKIKGIIKELNEKSTKIFGINPVKGGSPLNEINMGIKIIFDILFLGEKAFFSCLILE